MWLAAQTMSGVQSYAPWAGGLAGLGVLALAVYRHRAEREGVRLERAMATLEGILAIVSAAEVNGAVEEHRRGLLLQRSAVVRAARLHKKIRPRMEAVIESIDAFTHAEAPAGHGPHARHHQRIGAATADLRHAAEEAYDEVYRRRTR